MDYFPSVCAASEALDTMFVCRSSSESLPFLEREPSGPYIEDAMSACRKLWRERDDEVSHDTKQAVYYTIAHAALYASMVAERTTQGVDFLTKQDAADAMLRAALEEFGELAEQQASSWTAPFGGKKGRRAWMTTFDEAWRYLDLTGTVSCSADLDNIVRAGVVAYWKDALNIAMDLLVERFLCNATNK